jgi:hypothetical protein
LGNLQEHLEDAMQRNASPADIPLLQEARKQYAIGTKLIPLVGKSANGNISPQALMQRLLSDNSGKRAMAYGRGGDVGELAKIGQMFLKEPGTSMTAERGAGYGLLGGAAFAHPAAAAGVVGGANLYNRAGPAITRKILEGQIPPPPGTP